MCKKNPVKPKLVKVMDKRGDELLPRAKQVIEGDRAAIRAERDWQATREGLDAEIPAMPDYSDRPYGRIAAVIFLLIAAFIAGLAVGRMT